MVDMPKREREGSVEAPPSPSTRSIEEADLDADDNTVVVVGESPSSVGLERELERLGLDEDLKASIRTMSPTTQREVLNDVVRNRQFSPLLLVSEPAELSVPPSSHTHPSDPNYYDHPHPNSHNSNLNQEVGIEIRDREVVLFPEMMPAPPAGGPRDLASGPVDLLDLLIPLLSRLGTTGGRGDGAEPTQADARPENRRLARALAGLPIMQEIQQIVAMQSLGLDRDIDEMSYEELLELGDRIGHVSKGLHSAAELRSCLRRLRTPPEEGRCPICLDPFNAAETEAEGEAEGEGAATTTTTSTTPRSCAELRNCEHSFHLSCIKQWLKVDKRCPVCTREVLPVTSDATTQEKK